MSVADLLARAEAAGCRLTLRPDGRVHVAPIPRPDLLAELRAHRDAIAAELRRSAELLVRVRTGLGDEIDATLWRVLDRVLDARELPLADALWQHVVDADRRGIYSRLVGWLRSLAAAGDDLARVRALVESGPGRHGYHDAGRS